MVPSLACPPICDNTKRHISPFAHVSPSRFFVPLRKTALNANWGRRRTCSRPAERHIGCVTKLHRQLPLLLKCGRFCPDTKPYCTFSKPAYQAGALPATTPSHPSYVIAVPDCAFASDLQIPLEIKQPFLRMYDYRTQCQMVVVSELMNNFHREIAEHSRSSNHFLGEVG